MPDFKIYIRAENVEKWNSIENKSGWINGVLADTHVGMEATIGDETVQPIRVKDEITLQPVRTVRRLGDILSDIKQLEAERDEKLEFVQDPQEIVRVGKDYKSKIQPLWDEYHENKS